MELTAVVRRRARRRVAAPQAAGGPDRPDRGATAHLPSTEGGFLVASWLSRSAGTRRR